MLDLPGATSPNDLEETLSRVLSALTKWKKLSLTPKKWIRKASTW